jgi:hypothetical protein
LRKEISRRSLLETFQVRPVKVRRKMVEGTVVQDSRVELVLRHYRAMNGRAQSWIACQTAETE